MLRRLSTAGLGIALCLATARVGAAATVVTGAVDQAGFQALIGAAGPGDTIVCLGGVYDFSAPGPVYIDKALTIRAADAADPPVFRGDPGSAGSLLGNYGFVQAPGSFVDGLTIRGLRFENFDRALAFPMSADLFAPGCPLIAGAGARRLKILDNSFRATRRVLQIIGGPIEDFVFKGNDAEFIGWTHGIVVLGGWEPCPADGWSLVEVPRPAGGTIQGNSLRGEAFAGIFVDGAEQMSLKENLIEDVQIGIFFEDTKAYFFSDDGPVRLGSIKENVIHAGVAGVVAVGPTTITGAEIKDNEISGALVGILLHAGANHFDVKANDFAGSLFADVYLGLDEGGGLGESGPDTFDNKVRVGAGDTVLDFGVDNEIKVVD